MNNTKVLFKMMIKSGFDSLKKNKKNKTRKKPNNLTERIITLIIFGGILSGILFLIFKFYTWYYSMIESSGNGLYFNKLFLILVSFTVFVFGFSMVLQQLYYAKDINIYRALPIKKHQILLFRYFKVIVTGIVMFAAFLGPAFLVYGIQTAAGFMFYLYALLIIIFMPIIPMSLIGIIVLLVMRFTKRFKSSKAISIIPSLTAMIGIQFVIQPIIQLPLIPIGIESGFFDNMAKLIPGLTFAAKTLNETGSDALINFLILLVFVLISFGVFLLLGHFTYYKGLNGVGDNYSSKKSLSNISLYKKTKPRSQILSYVKKDFKNILRYPDTFMNLLFNQLLFPLMMLLFVGFGIFGETIDITALGDGVNSISLIDYVGEGVILAGVTVILSLFSIINLNYGSIVSKEGDGFYFMKFLPISLTKQVYLKSIIGLIVSGLQMIIMATLLLIIKVPLGLVIIGFALSTLIIFAIAQSGIIYETRNPKTNWNNIGSAVFISFNIIKTALSGALYLALSALPVYLVNIGNEFHEIGYSFIGYIIYIVLLFGILNVLFYLLINRKSKEWILRSN